ncbi:MAG: PQQ-binding-like beta-propeller repeat protein, partial [Spirochaetes bacterium]|nr:PQQ-binding-like beta-propeller repeat protein [Spirochaetota bacterium]
MTKKNVKYFIYGILIITLMLSGCTGRSSGDWVVFRGQSGQGNTSERIFPPIGIKWQFKLQEGGVRERRFNPPVVFQDTLFFGSSDSNFYALDLNTGFMRWVFKTRAPVNSVPYVDSRKVFFGSTDGYIYAVYHRTGTLAWEHFTGAPVNSTIVGHNDTIVFTTDLGATHFFTRYGREIKAIPNYVWLSNSFQINNDVVYFMPGPPENPFSLAAFHIPTQRYIWTLPTVGRQIWYSFPAISGNILHYASVGVMGNYFTYIFSALDRRTGEPIWQVFERSSLFD